MSRCHSRYTGFWISMIQGNAKLQGLTEQLHLTGNRYNVALVRQFMSLSRCPAYSSSRCTSLYVFTSSKHPG